MKLYSYSRSTTSFRVRAALNLKGLPYETCSVDLLSGAQRGDEYASINPGKGVPTLVLEDGTVLTQSLAIVDYLDAVAPEMPMLSSDPMVRAKMQAVALTVATDIHPVNNLRVVSELGVRFGADEGQRKAWMQHWMTEGFKAANALLDDRSSFAFSDHPGLADLCVVAQTYNAHRWDVDLTPFPRISRIERACLAIPEIAAAHPDNQVMTKDHA